MFLDYYLEVYYGENDNIRQMQQCITNFRHDLFTKRGMHRYSTHSEILRLSRLVEKEFGFKTFSLKISTTEKAFTNTTILGLDYHVFSKNNSNYENLIINNNGYKFKPEAQLVTYSAIDISFFENRKYTDREILALILHEIGHNFQNAISENQIFFTKLYIVTDVISVILNWMVDNRGLITGLIDTAITWSGLKRAIYTSFHEFCLSMPEIYELISNFKKTLIDIVYPLKRVIDYIMHIFKFKKIPTILVTKLNPLALANMFLKGSYRGEKIADSFVTMYGYGPDLQSALEKIDNMDQRIDINIPIISPIIGIAESTYSLLLKLPEDQPLAITRIRDQINYLERELSREDLDPKMKKEIQYQLDQLDGTLNRMISLNYENASSDFYYMNHVYQALLYYVFGGDPKDLLLSKLPKDDIHADIERTKNKKLMEEKSIVCKMLNNVKLI